MPSEPIIYLELGIGGMTCDDCAQAVAGALAAVPGVVDADVNLAERRAAVTARPGIAPETLTTAVRATGYNAFVRGRGESPGSRAG